MNTQTIESQSVMTPARALELLLEGNARFQKGTPAKRDLPQQVRATENGQWPFAAILSCMDSRASAELLFDQGIGDIFSIRVAGNLVNTDVLGSLEFACKAAGSKLVMVLGHTGCGAIKGACDEVELGNLTATLKKLRPAVDATSEPRDAAQRTSANGAFVRSVSIRNVELALDNIRERSEVLRQQEDAGEIQLVGALYDIATGQVELLGQD